MQMQKAGIGEYRIGPVIRVARGVAFVSAGGMDASMPGMYRIRIDTEFIRHKFVVGAHLLNRFGIAVKSGNTAVLNQRKYRLADGQRRGFVRLRPGRRQVAR